MRPGQGVPFFFASLLALALPASADTFDFSYQFNPLLDYTIVTGSFQGTQNGDFVTDISDISVAFDGIELPGSAYASLFTPEGGFAYNPIISFDAAQNHFMFSSLDWVTASGTGSAFGWYFNMGLGNAAAWASADQSLIYSLGIQNEMFDRWASYDTLTPTWTLTDVTPLSLPAAGAASVPDTGSTAVLLAMACAGLCCAGRRHRLVRKNLPRISPMKIATMIPLRD